MKSFSGIIDAASLESKTITVLCKTVTGAKIGQLVMIIPINQFSQLTELNEYDILKNRLNELDHERNQLKDGGIGLW